jgi:hypothetical protein
VARLIPAFFDDRTPPGEREVFALLEKAPVDWVAIHSLDLAPWNRGLRTEIDFMVIVPSTGILCIEVKSHERIEFDGECWNPTSITRSPFKQALDGSRTFARRLADLLPHTAKVPVIHLCIFPKARFEANKNLSVQPWEWIDRSHLALVASSGEFAELILGRMREAIRAETMLSSLQRPLTAAVVDEIVNHCVPVRRRNPSLREEIDNRRSELEAVLRVQQMPVLMLAGLNPRLLVTGPAGTGKTLIAMEVARRAAEDGKRVALLCHNQLVGDWIARQVNSPPLPNLIVGRAIQILMRIAGLRIPEQRAPDYWDLHLPLQLEEFITDPDLNFNAFFDYLVVDEAQDLMSRPALWNVLCMFLKNGLARGSFALFGDFENQSLGREAAAINALNDLVTVVCPTRWELAENCRNYRVVGEMAVRLSGAGASLYSGFLRTGGSGRDYDIHFYGSEEEQEVLLERSIREFISRGYRPSEITLLSFRSDMHSLAAKLLARGEKLVRPLTQGEKTTYATVHAFKGMENRVIILTDVTLGDAGFERSLFYTGMTRATDSVRILCHTSSRATLARWLTT